MDNTGQEKNNFSGTQLEICQYDWTVSTVINTRLSWWEVGWMHDGCQWCIQSSIMQFPKCVIGSMWNSRLVTKYATANL